MNAFKKSSYWHLWEHKTAWLLYSRLSENTQNTQCNKSECRDWRGWKHSKWFNDKTGQRTKDRLKTQISPPIFVHTAKICVAFVCPLLSHNALKFIIICTHSRGQDKTQLNIFQKLNSILILTSIQNCIHLLALHTQCTDSCWHLDHNYRVDSQFSESTLLGIMTEKINVLYS